MIDTTTTENSEEGKAGGHRRGRRPSHSGEAPVRVITATTRLTGHWVSLLGVTAAALFSLNVIATYPGFLSYDSIVQVGQALDPARLNDWHPPVMTALWWLLIRLPTNPALPMLLWQLALLWGSLLGLAVYIYQETNRRRISLLPLLLGLFPYIANNSANIWKDCQFAFALLASVVVLLYVRRGIARAWLHHAALLSVTLLIAYAGAVRYNALPAIVPLLFLVKPAARKASVRFRVVFAAGVIGGALLATPAINAVHPVLATHPAGSIMLDDVMHIYSAADLRSADVSQSLKRSLLGVQRLCPPDKLQINYTWGCATSGNITKFFTTQFDYDGLRRLYIHGLTEHPLRFLKYRAGVYATFLDPTPAQSYIWAGRIHGNPYGLSFEPNFLTYRLQSYVCAAFNNLALLYKPWFWLTVGLVLLVITLRRRRRLKHASMILAVCTSSLVYILTYFPMVIGYDYRYIYWASIGLSAAAILLLADCRQHRSEPELLDSSSR